MEISEISNTIKKKKSEILIIVVVLEISLVCFIENTRFNL